MICSRLAATFLQKLILHHPCRPISGHSVITPMKFSLDTVLLCIDRQYWGFDSIYRGWWVLYAVKWWMRCINMFPTCARSFLNTLWWFIRQHSLYPGCWFIGQICSLAYLGFKWLTDGDLPPYVVNILTPPPTPPLPYRGTVECLGSLC